MLEHRKANINCIYLVLIHCEQTGCKRGVLVVEKCCYLSKGWGHKMWDAPWPPEGSDANTHCRRLTNGTNALIVNRTESNE